MQRDGRPAPPGDAFVQIGVLTERNRSNHDLVLEARLVQLRCEAFPVFDPAPSARAAIDPVHVPPLVDGLPEVDAAELTAEIVRSAIDAHGSLLVRGMLAEDECRALREDIDRAYEARLAGDTHSPWYLPLRLDGPRGDEVEAGRGYLGERALLAADSPRSLFDLVEIYRRRGLPELVRGVLGEAPVLSVKKTTLRRVHSSQFNADVAAEGVVGGWHQDGSFLGPDTQTLNMWLALAPAGVDAPGLEMVGKRLPSLVPTGTASTWRTSIDAAEAVAEGKLVHPVFDTGDAILFDHLALHQTYVRPEMTETRYAIESWFFAPSSVPLDRVPLVF